MAARRSAFFSILVLTLTVLLAACGGGSASNGRATTTAAPSTGTPAAPQMKGLDEALALLHDEPNVQAVIDAVQRKDVDALLTLIDWHPTPCGNPHGEGTCPPGSPNAEVQTVYAGFADTYEARKEIVQPALEQLLNGEPLAVTFVSKAHERYGSRGENVSPGPAYFVGFEGTARAVEASPIWGDAGSKSGLFLELNAGSSQPIIELGALDGELAAVAQGIVFVRDLDWFAMAPPVVSGTKPPSFATFRAVIGTPSSDGSRIVLEPAACAAGSNEPFLAVQREVEFAIYCPTYLPDGFTMKRVSLDPPKSGTPTFLTAVFAQPDGTEIDFWQFIPGNDVFPQWRQYGPPARVGPVAYGGDFLATLWDVWTAPSQPKSAVVWGVAPDGRYHVISGNSATLDADTMRRIAEGMVRLGPLGTPPP
jgi:hypothetical protein